MLERYASRFDAVEINSSFYRPHRPSTYERWAASVPPAFRFALKLPREITHVRKLTKCEALVTTFLAETAGLGAKRDVLLVQLPPSLAFETRVTEAFFAHLRAAYGGHIACEPRHATWGSSEANEVLRATGIARVVADPQTVPDAPLPSGVDFAYYRLHGSPRMYYSDYEAPARRAWATRVRHDAERGPAWCVFDNTAAGAATTNALAFRDLVIP